ALAIRNVRHGGPAHPAIIRWPARTSSRQERRVLMHLFPRLAAWLARTGLVAGLLAAACAPAAAPSPTMAPAKQSPTSAPAQSVATSAPAEPAATSASAKTAPQPTAKTAEKPAAQPMAELTEQERKAVEDFYKGK